MTQIPITDEPEPILVPAPQVIRQQLAANRQRGKVLQKLLRVAELAATQKAVRGGTGTDCEVQPCT